MSISTCWHDLVDEVARLFPEVRAATLLANEGDIGALIMHISAAHELTFAEAAEVVVFRLPVYVEPQRLTA